MEQWAQKPDKTRQDLRVVNNTYISFIDGKNSLLRRQLNYNLHFNPLRSGSKT